MEETREVSMKTVRQIKARTVKALHQNVQDLRLQGLAVKEAMQELGLWNEKEKRR